MNRRWRDPNSIQSRLAAWIGPEVVALVLSVLVVLVVAMVSGVGPFS
jgi:hypothetical protein